jgi:hypothetical protein
MFNCRFNNKRNRAKTFQKISPKSENHLWDEFFKPLSNLSNRGAKSSEMERSESLEHLLIIAGRVIQSFKALAE